MIPQIIHYCWFGRNPLPKLAEDCIESWKKYCPDYEIVRWDETNFDMNYNEYVREAYGTGKWAFVTDVVRLYVLVNYGGIYMDTDVEVLKPLDDLLNYEAFSGFEGTNTIQTGIIASQKNQPLFYELLHEYDNIHFKQPDGLLDLTTNVERITKTCIKYGLRSDNTMQTIRGFTLFPSDYFCPKNYATGELHITKNTYSIHHFSASWLSDTERKTIEYLYSHKTILPRKFIKFAFVLRYDGLKAALRKVMVTLRKRGAKS